MLNGVDPGGDQLARVRHRCVDRHPGPGSVGCGDQLGDGLDRVGGLGVGPGGQVGEVSDHLDPPRPPADFGDRCADQLSLGHRGVEQVREVATRGSQEPAGGLEHGHAGPRSELQGHAAPRPDIADQGDPRLRPGEQVGARGALIQGHQAHRPGTDSRVGMGINQAGQDKAAWQELSIGDRAVMDCARCVDPPRRRLVAEGKLYALHCPCLHPVTLATGPCARHRQPGPPHGSSRTGRSVGSCRAPSCRQPPDRRIRRSRSSAGRHSVIGLTVSGQFLKPPGASFQ
jgi:hypothetical protein